jgi:hypothetical protein
MGKQPFGINGGTVSGAGSTLDRTERTRQALSDLIKRFKVVNDAGCGDFFWMSQVDLSGVDYVGYDLIYHPQWELYPRIFVTLDITQDKMRDCDLIICRDVLIHLPPDMAAEAVDLFRQTGKYLLAPSYTEGDNSGTIDDINHKTNMEIHPFNLGKPEWFMGDTENGEKRYLGLWKL